MFAVIKDRNNQFKAIPGKEYLVDLMENSNEKKIVFSEILLIVDGDKVKIGDPIIKNASVEAEILDEAKGPKVSGIKFHSKKRYQRNLGHKQKYTKIKIIKINQKNEK